MFWLSIAPLQIMQLQWHKKLITEVMIMQVRNLGKGTAQGGGQEMEGGLCTVMSGTSTEAQTAGVT